MNDLEKVDKKRYSLNKVEISIIVIFFVLALLWSIFVPSNYAPDEGMRYPLPKFIYANKKLPLPDDPAVVQSVFNASYAYYPLLLGSIVSAIFMKMVGILGAGETGLLIAARFTSVISGTCFIYFLIKISKRLCNKPWTKYFMIFLGSCMPQFLFLSSYVNNDVIAVAASSMMVYAWVISLTDGWNIKNSILLALGIIICALSYYDAYAWILMSIVFFVFSFIKIKVIDKSKEEEEKEDKKGKKIEFNYKDMFKYGIIISIIVLVGISYFFIRSIIVNHGDMLGIKSFLSACEEGGADFIKPSNRDTAKNLNMTYLEMLKSTRWIGMTWMEATFKSFVCYIGAMQYQSDNWIYIFYKVLFIVGLVGMLLAFIFNTKKNAKMKIFYLSLLVSAIVPVLLSIQYSYATDYQSQGRYVYPMWMSLIIFTTTGIEFLLSVILKFIKNEKVKNIIKILVYAILSIIIIYILLVKANSLFMETIKL